MTLHCLYVHITLFQMKEIVSCLALLQLHQLHLVSVKGLSTTVNKRAPFWAYVRLHCRPGFINEGHQSSPVDLPACRKAFSVNSLKLTFTIDAVAGDIVVIRVYAPNNSAPTVRCVSSVYEYTDPALTLPKRPSHCLNVPHIV